MLPGDIMSVPNAAKETANAVLFPCFTKSLPLLVLLYTFQLLLRRNVSLLIYDNS